MRALATWSGALMGLMMIIIGGMVPSAVVVPSADFSPKILALASTWQVPALLLCAMVCGPRAGIIAALAYLTIGLFYLPVFYGGGNFEYVSNPGFGYLAGFIPAAWLSGRLASKPKRNTLINLTLAALAGLLLLQTFGLLNLIIGSSMGRWPNSLQELIFSFSIAPLAAQIILCPAVGILALTLRSVLLVE